MATLTEFVLLPWREATRTALVGASQGGSQVLMHCRSIHQWLTFIRDTLHCASLGGANS